MVAFAPSFALVMLGAPYFERLRHSRHARAFLDGAGPAAAGAILGAAVPLARAIDDAGSGSSWPRRPRPLLARVPPIWVLVCGGLAGLATTL